MKKWLLGALAAALIAVAAPGRALAQDAFRPGTRPGYAALVTGPNVGILLASGGAAVGWNIQLGAGYHFSGNSGGFYLGGDINMVVSFAGGFGMLFQPRIGYDIPITGGFYVGPTAAFGLGFAASGLGAAFALSPQLGFDMKFVIVDRLLIWVRPFGLSFPIAIAGGATAAMQIDFVNFGVGATF